MILLIEGGNQHLGQQLGDRLEVLVAHGELGPALSDGIVPAVPTRRAASNH